MDHNIYINKHYDESLYPEIKTVIIPKGADFVNFNRSLLSESPNIFDFIIDEENHDFEFTNGVLFCSRWNKRRDIIYITKQVKELAIGEDIDDIDDLCNWSVVEKVSTNEENTKFIVKNGLVMTSDQLQVLLALPNLTEIEIPDGVKKTKYRAFASCHQLKRIVFPESYDWCDSHLRFSEQASHPEVIIKGNGAYIENDIVIARDYTPKARLYLGDPNCCRIPRDLIKTYGFEHAFANVVSFQVDPENPVLSSENGVILDKTKTKLVFYPRARTYFEIPETVKTIGDYSVEDCLGLKEALIPKHVVTIEGRAFSRCNNLSKVVILNPQIDAARTAFVGCKLETVGGVYYAGSLALAVVHGDAELNIREGTTKLWLGEPSWLWPRSQSAPRIGTLYLPSSLLSIDEHLNTPIDRIEVDKDNPVFCSIEGVLYTKDMKLLIRYPEERIGDEYAVPDGVERIGECAFHHCSFLKRVILPNSIKSIEKDAFAYTSITYIEMPAKPIKIEKEAIAFTFMDKYGNKHSGDAIYICYRHDDWKIGISLADNFEKNGNEVNLARFLKTEDQNIKHNAFQEVKNTAYKQFMALYSILANGEAEYIQYLSRSAKQLVKEAIDNRDMPLFTALVNSGIVKKSVVSELVDYANSNNASEYAAVLQGADFATITAKVSSSDQIAATSPQKDLNDLPLNLKQYELFIDRTPEIDFEGKTFVFSGMGYWGGVPEDDPVVARVINRGGVLRQKVSGKTDCLVVGPELWGTSNLDEAIEQKKKGKNLKIVILKDFKKILDQTNFKQSKSGGVVQHCDLFDKVERIKLCYQNRICRYGDFRDSSDGSDIDAVFSKNGWILGWLDSSIEWAERYKEKFDEAYVVVGDLTVEQLDAGKLKKDYRKIERAKNKYKLQVFTEGDLLSAGIKPYKPFPAVKLNSIEGLKVCCRGTFKHGYVYLNNCITAHGGIPQKGNPTKATDVFVVADKEFDECCIHSSGIADDIRKLWGYYLKNKKPLLFTETQFTELGFFAKPGTKKSEKDD